MHIYLPITLAKELEKDHLPPSLCICHATCYLITILVALANHQQDYSSYHMVEHLLADIKIESIRRWCVCALIA